MALPCVLCSDGVIGTAESCLTRFSAAPPSISGTIPPFSKSSVRRRSPCFSLSTHAKRTFSTCRYAFSGHRRSEEHTSELQSLMRISYAVFCLKQKNNTEPTQQLQKHDNI